MVAAELIFQAIGALSALVGCIAIAIAARQLHFNCWLKAQEIFTEGTFVKAREKVYSRLPGRTNQLGNEWTEQDFLVCRKMDELVRLAPYLGLFGLNLFGTGKQLILETWKDPLAKSWIALKALVEKEQNEKWPKKWRAFAEFGKEAVAQLERDNATLRIMHN